MKELEELKKLKKLYESNVADLMAKGYRTSFKGKSIFEKTFIKHERARRPYLINKIAELIKYSERKNGDFVILDMGCGTGDIAVELLRKLRNNPVDITGIDISKEALTKTYEINSDEKTKLNLIQCDGRFLPFPHGTFDMAYVSTVFINQTDSLIRKVLKETYRSIKDDGYLVVNEPGGILAGEHMGFVGTYIRKLVSFLGSVHYAHYSNIYAIFKTRTQKELRNMIEEIGFRIEEITCKWLDGFQTLIAKKYVRGKN